LVKRRTDLGSQCPRSYTQQDETWIAGIADKLDVTLSSYLKNDVAPFLGLKKSMFSIGYLVALMVIGIIGLLFLEFPELA